MEAKNEWEARAKFEVNDAVYWRGTVYRVEARYYRRSFDAFVYDLKEIVALKKSFRLQHKVREQEMEPWTMGMDER